MDWISGATESVRGNDGSVLVRSTPQCLRTDIPCFSAMCLSCKNGEKHQWRCEAALMRNMAETRGSLLPGDASHYAVPTPRALEDYNDIFCASDMRGVIVTQVNDGVLLL